MSYESENYFGTFIAGIILTALVMITFLYLPAKATLSCANITRNKYIYSSVPNPAFSHICWASDDGTNWVQIDTRAGT
jgi:hypothetical protein